MKRLRKIVGLGLASYLIAACAYTGIAMAEETAQTTAVNTASTTAVTQTPAKEHKKHVGFTKKTKKKKHEEEKKTNS